MIKSTSYLFAIIFALGAFAIGQSGGVKGKVKGPNGKGIPSASIRAYKEGTEIKSTTADAKGEFSITGLSSGKYNIVFDADGYSTGTLHGIEIESGILNLGDRLVLSRDRGDFVFVQGGVFFKEGSSVTGAKVELEQVNGDGSTKSLGNTYSNVQGEFSFRRPPGMTKYRVTAKLKGISATKDIDVEEVAVYRVSLRLDLSRDDR